VVKVFTHENKVKAEFEELNKKLEKSMAEANTWAGSMGPVNNNFGHLQYVVLVLVGAVSIIMKPELYTIGALAAFLQLSKSFSNNISQISQQANNILLALAGAERIYKILDETGEMDDGDVTLVRVKEEDGKICEVKERTGHWAWKTKDGDESKLVPLRGGVVMDHVDFGYNEEKTVLHDISLYAKPGQKIAFVGSTGAGKTTITNLLNRFYNIRKGTITIDGIDIRRMKLDDLRRSMAMVLQDTSLFTGTIRDNIRYGRMDATEEEVEKAAKLANAHDFIMMMKDGYDTVITNNGENLSQGQRQLLSIARAAIADPPIMVLDEATSSIDTHTEALVQSGMDKLMENRTVFVIAHRLSTVRNSNAIMVLEDGRIIERGDHDDLIAAKGVYYNLYTGKEELS
ncbi:MAG: ABC transporter ATP-binding protein, partial [Candidatus Ornithospirochaeta sp.]